MKRVYLSSTLSDLEGYRREAIQVMQGIGATPITLDSISATDESPIDLCVKAVQSSDVVVLIVAHRYGVVLPGSEFSIVELEYNAAVNARIPLLAFLVDEEYPWPGSLVDQGGLAVQLVRFKEHIRQEHVVEYFTTPSDFGLRLLRALSHLLELEDTPVAVSERSPSGETATEVLIRIEKHLQSLQMAFSGVQAGIERIGEGEISTSRASSRITMNPQTFLGPIAPKVDPWLCFVAMPYSKTWSTALETTLADICRQEDYIVLVAKNMTGRFIPHDIWQGITGAGVIIADITDGNPNVAYEIGLADVLGKDVILLCQGDNVPFDFLGQRLIQYKDSIEGTIKLREELVARLQELKRKV